MSDSISSSPSASTSDRSVVPYDELRGTDGALRPHWQRYFEQLDVMGPAEAKVRWTKAKRLLQENGVSYSVYRDSTGSERPWRLSPLPLLLNTDDWQQLARGVAQRARLLSRLLADIYGPQHCLTNGYLPGELVFDNPRFLRALHGMDVPRQAWVPLYGVDLIRAPNGNFLAIEDVTQSPSGMGYALENRLVVAQALPELLRHCHVERLVFFFRSLLERLRDSTPHNRDAPRVALLTPGPYSPTYFEQAYLAKYLGLSLVQGEDLTVRDNRVYLKTLGGLQPIDVLLRRVFDDYCDPLELLSDSALGVPGLVQALRTGNVCSMNPLGTGILETPGLLAYLPTLCREFLKEELILNSVPTYYCGNALQLEQALSDFDQMVVKPAYAIERTAPIFVGQLAPAERDALEVRLLANPNAFIAQRFVPGARTPVIANNTLHPRSYVLRCFAHCIQPNDYQVMPGGLALVAPSDGDLAVSIDRGARSKDVWVISDDSALAETLTAPTNPTIELSRGGGDLPSRVADNLYWLGRYAERAEATCRLVRVIGAKLLESANDREYERGMELASMLNALRAQTQFLYATELSLDSTLDRTNNETELARAISNDACSGSIVSTLRSALRVSNIVRDRLSHDTWRILASLEDSIARCSSDSAEIELPQLINELSQIVITLTGFSGLVMESMSRGFAWRFLDMGRRLERAISLVTLLRTTFTTASEREASLVEMVLDVADSGMTYRRRYPAGLQAAPAVDLLLADDTNPRSVIFQLHTLSQHVAALPSLSSLGAKTTQQRLLLATTTEVELCDVSELCELPSTSARREALVTLLDRLGRAIPALSDSLSETYLYHANVAKQLRSSVSMPPELVGNGGVS